MRTSAAREVGSVVLFPCEIFARKSQSLLNVFVQTHRGRSANDIQETCIWANISDQGCSPRQSAPQVYAGALGEKGFVKKADKCRASLRSGPTAGSRPTAKDWKALQADCPSAKDREALQADRCKKGPPCQDAGPLAPLWQDWRALQEEASVLVDSTGLGHVTALLAKEVLEDTAVTGILKGTDTGNTAVADSRVLETMICGGFERAFYQNVQECWQAKISKASNLKASSKWSKSSSCSRSPSSLPNKQSFGTCSPRRY